MTRFDVDFSLAMHNRTGKFFIGRDLLECASDLLGKVYYWRLPADKPPQGIWAKIVCRIQGMQIRANASGGLLGCQFRPNPARPLLHLEPYTVLGVRLRKKDAVIVHDVGPITHPELFERRLHLAYQRIFTEIDKVGPHLIFVSEASQREFERVFPNCRPASSRVLYPAIRTDVISHSQQSVATVQKPYLLTTGSLGDRKNQVRSIAAFERSGLAERGVSYVLCGPNEPGHEAVVAAAARTKGVKLLSYVSDGELAWLYANASGFVLASLLEGFGIPLAEAIDHNVIPLVTAEIGRAHV